ncbi:hypothetical protein [Methylorubrum thiocyanatum]|uniref:hypothetical protein n=1 Tax=Methylorubrum thiocyanatum TaxID=47958 RepID=UPI003F7F5AA9
MGQIVKSGECQNSPKNAAMEEIAIAIFGASQDDIRELLADNVTLHLADGTQIEGSEATNLYVAQHVRRGFDLLKIDHAITHGRVGAANGFVSIEGRQNGFSVFVEFVNTKAERLKAIKLYGF